MSFVDQLLAVEEAAADARLKFPAAYSRRRRLGGPAQPKVVVQAHTAGHGWTASGANYDSTNTNLNDTTQFDIGGQSIKLVSLGNGGNAAVAKTLPAPVDVSDCDVRIRFRLTDTNAGIFQVNVGNTTFSQVSTVTFSVTSTTSMANWPWQPGRWAVLDIPRSHFAAGADWTAIQRVQVIATDKSVSTTVHIAGIEFIRQDPAGKGPMAVWTLDDSFASQDAIVRPALAAQGWKATLMPIIDKLDLAGSLTTAQVRDLHDVHGWEIGAHAYTNAAHTLGMPALTQAQRIAELEAILAWMDGYGFASNSYAWPLGTHDAASEADVASYFSAARNAFAPLLEPVTLPRRYAFQAVNVGTQTASLHSLIDKAKASNALIVFVVHDIGAASGNNITAATLDDTVSYLAASGIPVKTMGEALATLIG